MSPEVAKIEVYRPAYFSDFIRWDATNQPKRLEGQYALGTAKAELTIERRHNQGGEFETWEYRLELKFEKLKDGQRLYTLIRAGKISPVVDYKGEQSETVERQIKDVLRELLILCGVKLRRWEII